MKYKRLVCAVFALMLVGTSVASTAAVFADEPTGIDAAGENMGEENIENTAGEEEVAGGNDAANTTAGETVEEETTEPAVAPAVEGAVLRAAAAPAAIQANDEGTTRVAEPTRAAVKRYDIEQGDKVNLSFDGVNFSRGTYRCNITDSESNVTSDLTCDTSMFGGINGRVSSKNTALGEYTVVVERQNGGHYEWQGTWPHAYPVWVEDWEVAGTAIITVYNLDVEAQENTILEPGDEFEYTINEENTFGNVEVTVTRDGEEIDATNGIDTSEEGEYKISIVNTSAAAAGYNNERAEYYFYVIDATSERMVVEQGEIIELNGSARWSADYVHSDPSGQDFEADESGEVLVDTNELRLGVHRFEVAHTFETGERETVNNVTVIIYKITAAEGEYSEEDYAAAADTLKDLVDQYGEADGPGDMIKLITKIGEIFGATDEGAMAAGSFGMGVLSGNEIVTRAHVEELSEDEVSEALIAKIADLGAENVTYWDVTVWMEIETARGVFPLGQLHQLDNAITVAVVEVPDVEAGYTRTYYVVREHDGQIEVLTEGVDFVVVDGEVYIIADKFSTYAVAYKDTLIPVTYTLKAPETGEATETTEVEGGASASLSMAVVTAIAAVTLAGAAVIAKRK